MYFQDVHQQDSSLTFTGALEFSLVNLFADLSYEENLRNKNFG